LNYYDLTVVCKDDALVYHVGFKFSTPDQDNDASLRSCAVEHKGAWWYGACLSSNLNGLYLRGDYTSSAHGLNEGVSWVHWKGQHYSLKFTEMKIKPY